jgi:diguanylate cyclase (GGDEF)-like protein/PAS domain S-box-containing protein
LKKPVQTGFSLALLLLGGGGGLSLWGSTKLEQTVGWVNHTYEVIGKLSTLLSALKDAETGQRGYLLTGQESYLEPYSSGTQATKQDFQSLRQLTIDSSSQQKYLDSLEIQIASKFRVMAKSISLRKSQGFASALQVVQTNEGKRAMDGIRMTIQAMETQEKTLLATRQANASAVLRRGVTAITLSGALAAVCTPLALFALYQSRRKRQQAESYVQLLQTLSLGVSKAENFDAALLLVLSTVCQAKGWAYGEAWIPSPEENVLKCSLAWYDKEPFESVAQGDSLLLKTFKTFKTLSQDVTFAPGIGLPGRVLALKRPEWQADVSQEQESDIAFLRHQAASQCGLKAGFGIPVMVSDEVLAVMVFFKLEAAAADHQLIESLVSIAMQLGTLLQRKQIEQAFQESEQRFQLFMNSSSTVAFMKDQDGRYVYGNETLEQLFDVKMSDLLGKTDFDWLPEKIAKEVGKNDREVLTNWQGVELLEEVPTSDGENHYWLVSKFPFQDSAGRKYVGGVALDVTGQKRLEQALFREKELAQVTLHSIGDAVITTNAAGEIQYLNPVAEGLTGWNQQEAQGLPLTDIFKIVNETTREPVENPVEKALREGRIVGLANHTVLIDRDGREIAIDDSAAPIRASDGEVIGAVLVFHDVSHNRSLSRQLSWQASHDALTGLVNRPEFEIRLEEAATSAKAQNLHHALCYLDLDQFKIVNDTCGHIAGDELLRQVTALLQTPIRKTDTLARLGGDEFGLLLNQCSLEQARKVANNLLEQMQSFRFSWQDKVFAVGVSIGLVSIDAGNQGSTKTLSLADAACYAAKNRGRNRIHVYQADDLELAQQQGEMQWVTKITQALEENRFRLYYQSIVPVSGAQLQGEHYEVLLRLQDETGALVSPMAFIPAAERYNLMHKIDRWVISSLFATQGQHYREFWKSCQSLSCGCNHLYAINLSGASINDDQFVKFLHEQFALYQIPPQLICFEITETVAIANLSKAAKLIHELKELGCRFSLDDFGSGMSSFAYLKNLPVDYIKIDGGFVKQVVDHSTDLVIVEAIHKIAQDMGIQTIAEFVENDLILDKIKEIGIDYAQGYGIAKPCPLPLSDGAEKVLSAA